ncbi:PQQ-binding-like beta-propeller repeat protein [Micromonospora sp. CPCC 205711]|uniref:outer membrane protein assembly factor BamB family protein n=1 Tax=Micromonospora sp. CPCC 205547 TaxID=3122400 RepID=UPI002FF35A0F
MTIIELGEVRDDAEPEPPRRPSGTVGRPGRIALVLVLALVAVGGAAPPQRREPFTVPARSGSAAYLTGDRLLVTEPADAATGRAGQLSAYAVPAAGAGPLSPLWRVPVPAAGGYGGLRIWNGLVFLVSGAQRDGPFRTFAFDLATGRPRWEQPGAGFEAGDGLLIINDLAGESRGVRLLDPATGRPRWTLPVVPGATSYRFRSDGVDRIVLTPATGPAEVRDARTGLLLRRAPINSGDLPVVQQAQVVDDLLLVVRDYASRVTAYGLDGLERRWELRLGLISGFADCGTVICAYGQTGGVWGLDPATGTVRWRAPGWRTVTGERAGRLLASLPAFGAQEAYAFLDAATGRPIREVGSWNLAAWYPPDGRLVGLRPTPDGRLVVAELDLDTARARVLDVLPGVSGECQAGGDLLLCRREDDSYGLWRLTA